MAVTSETTLQLDEDRQVAVQTSASGGGGGGGGDAIEVIQLDGSSGSVTETLPAPEDGAQVLYVRVDDNSAATATIEDPNGSDIYISPEKNSPDYDLSTRERVFLVSDGTSWYVEYFEGVGVETFQLDASGGNVTQTLPAPDQGAALVVSRIDDSTNAATVETADTASQEIRFPQGKDASSVDLRPGESLLITADGTHWHVEEGQGLRAEAEDVTSDGATRESPRLTQTATYDSDTSGGVTSSNVSIERYVRTDTDGNAVLVYEHDGTEIARLTDAGRLETRKDQEAFADGSLASGQGTNSLLSVENSQGDVLTTDAATLQFTGSGVSVTEPNPDEIVVDVSGGSGSDIDIEQNQTPVVGGATGLSFEGSGIDDVTNDGDGTATVSISKGSSTEVQEGGTAQVTDVTVLDFIGSDFNVDNPTSGEAEVSLGNVDADTLDGVDGSNYARTDVNETFNNDLYVNGGNVGIGTTSPQEALHILDSRPDIRLDDNNDSAYAVVRGAANGIIVLEADPTDSVSGTDIRLETDGTEALRVDASQQVGIGTTSPSNALEVNGSIFAKGEQQIIGIDASDEVRLGFIKQFGFGPKIGAEKGSDITLGHLDTTNLRSFTNSTDWNPRLTINTNGNVGIGTTSPSYALDVNGTAAASTLRLGDYTVTQDSSDGDLNFFHSGSKVLELTDGGVLRAAGDVVAFGLSGGSSTSGGGGFSIAGAGLTSPDGDTIEVDIGEGLTINNNDVLEADGGVGVSSVFGRTGDVTASAGDYSASQISNFDAEAVNALQAHDGTNVDADTLDGKDAGAFFQQMSDRFLLFPNDSSPSGRFRVVKLSGSPDLQVDHTSAFATNYLNFDASAQDAYTDVFWGFNGVRSPSYPVDVNGTGNFSGDLYTSGNVGIGTTSPSNALEVNGSIFAKGEQQIIGIDSSDEVRLGFIKQFGFGPKIGAEKGSDITLGHLDTTNLRSFTNSTNWNPRLTINTNGNVGIGTTSPSYALDVNGDINASGVGRFDITGDAESVDGLDGFQIARTDTSEIFTDQIRIDGPLAGSDNEIGGNDDFVLALGGRPHGVDDTDNTGDNRLGSGVLQTAHGNASDYRTYLQGGHGRVAHTWNAYYDSSASTWRSVVDNEPHTLVGIGNIAPGNVNGGGVTLATADAVNTANADNEQDAEDPIDWNVGLHVDVDGSVIVQGTDSSSGYTLNVDGSGDLVITTPTGNKAKILSNGDIEAFA